MRQIIDTFHNIQAAISCLQSDFGHVNIIIDIKKVFVRGVLAKRGAAISINITKWFCKDILSDHKGPS